MIVYRPLARGLLTAKYRQKQDCPEGTCAARQDGPTLELLANPNNWTGVDRLVPWAPTRQVRRAGLGYPKARGTLCHPRCQSSAPRD